MKTFIKQLENILLKFINYTTIRVINLGAKPKYYGIGSSPITNAYAGVSSVLRARLRNNEAPFGLGGNLDSTSYGKKWIEKTEKWFLSNLFRGLKSKPK